MAGNISAFQANSAHRNSAYTVASIKRWSCGDIDPPSQVDEVKSLHIYDFDNTLFASPLPNRQIWKFDQIGFLQSQDGFVNGGWWHDVSILSATGEGVEKEEPRAWAGWWNEEIVQLVETSMQQPNALTVLLTGRSESRFQDLIKRILASKGLVFDMIVLKPEAGPMNEKFGSTMKFKQAFLGSLINTYTSADEIRIYEDRVKHVEEFRNFLDEYSSVLHDPYHPKSATTRATPIKGEVIEVAEKATHLDPVVEVATIQNMINVHNTAFASSDKPPTRATKPYVLRRTVFFTGYLISPQDTKRLLKVANLPSRPSHSNDLRIMANSIMIRFGPSVPESILAKAGGIGHKIKWRCVQLGSLDNRIWAARLEPVPANASYYTEGQPTVVLALSGTSKTYEASRIHKWTSLAEEDQVIFETVVGEKVQLRIEEEHNSNGTQNRTPRKAASGNKRAFQEDDFPALGTVPTGPAGGRVQQQNRGPPSGPRVGGNSGGGRGGAHNSRGNNRGGRNGGQGRSGRSNGKGKGGYYHSLDDMGGTKGGGGVRGGGYDGADDNGGLTY